MLLLVCELLALCIRRMILLDDNNTKTAMFFKRKTTQKVQPLIPNQT